MLADIMKVHPNPYRDFKINPIMQDRVEVLIASYKENGDFGILAARKNGATGHFEIACGHHRLEAMKLGGFQQVELKVGNYNDDTMVSIMVDENARLFGQDHASTVLDAVCAAIRRIVMIALTNEWGGLPETSRPYFGSEDAFNSVRGKILKGEGVGRDIVRGYLKDRLPKTAIESALKIIKGSDKHLEIIQAVQADIAAEHERFEAQAKLAERAREEANLRAKKRREEAEERAAREAAKQAALKREREEAARAAKEAKEQRDRELAERKAAEIAAREAALEQERKLKEQEYIMAEAEEEERRAEEAAYAEKIEAERARKAALAKEAEQAAKRTDASAPWKKSSTKGKINGQVFVKFDASIGTVFKRAAHLEIFRQTVTSETMAAVMPYEHQRACAKELVDWHKRNGIELTEKSIGEWLHRELSNFLRGAKVNEEAEKLAIKENLDKAIFYEYENLRKSVTRIASVCARLQDKYREYPAGETPPVRLDTMRLIPATIAGLQVLHERLSKFLEM